MENGILLTINTPSAHMLCALQSDDLGSLRHHSHCFAKDGLAFVKDCSVYWIHPHGLLPLLNCDHFQDHVLLDKGRVEDDHLSHVIVVDIFVILIWMDANVCDKADLFAIMLCLTSFKLLVLCFAGIGANDNNNAAKS